MPPCPLLETTFPRALEIAEFVTIEENFGEVTPFGSGGPASFSIPECWLDTLLSLFLDLLEEVMRLAIPLKLLKSAVGELIWTREATLGMGLFLIPSCSLVFVASTPSVPTVKSDKLAKPSVEVLFFPRENNFPNVFDCNKPDVWEGWSTDSPP